MKLFSSTILFLSSFVMFNAYAVDVTTDNIPEKGSGIKHIPYDLRGEYDKTDIFAIPLDDSEVEEQIEMQELQELQKEIEARKK